MGSTSSTGRFCRGWSWKDQPGLFSGKHKRTGVNLQVLVGPTGRLRWASDPLPGATHDAKAITASGILEEIEASCCIGDKGYLGTGITTPDKKPPKGELTKAQKQANKSLNKIRYVVERTIAHIKAWKILAHDYRRPLDTFKETITATLALKVIQELERTPSDLGKRMRSTPL